MYPLILPGFNETSNVKKDFQKETPQTKFHENPFGGSRTVPC
jgi:hypothetical protein